MIQKLISLWMILLIVCSGVVVGQQQNSADVRFTISINGNTQQYGYVSDKWVRYESGTPVPITESRGFLAWLTVNTRFVDIEKKLANSEDAATGLQYLRDSTKGRPSEQVNVELSDGKTQLLSQYLESNQKLGGGPGGKVPDAIGGNAPPSAGAPNANPPVAAPATPAPTGPNPAKPAPAATPKPAAAPAGSQTSFSMLPGLTLVSPNEVSSFPSPLKSLLGIKENSVLHKSESSGTYIANGNTFKIDANGITIGNGKTADAFKLQWSDHQKSYVLENTNQKVTGIPVVAKDGKLSKPTTTDAATRIIIVPEKDLAAVESSLTSIKGNAIQQKQIGDNLVTTFGEQGSEVVIADGASFKKNSKGYAYHDYKNPSQVVPVTLAANMFSPGFVVKKEVKDFLNKDSVQNFLASGSKTSDFAVTSPGGARIGGDNTIIEYGFRDASYSYGFGEKNFWKVSDEGADPGDIYGDNWNNEGKMFTPYKFVTDSKGKPTAVPLADHIDIKDMALNPTNKDDIPTLKSFVDSFDTLQSIARQSGYDVGFNSWDFGGRPGVLSIGRSKPQSSSVGTATPLADTATGTTQDPQFSLYNLYALDADGGGMQFAVTGDTVVRTRFDKSTPATPDKGDFRVPDPSDDYEQAVYEQGSNRMVSYREHVKGKEDTGMVSEKVGNKITEIYGKYDTTKNTIESGAGAQTYVTFPVVINGKTEQRTSLKPADNQQINIGEGESKLEGTIMGAGTKVTETRWFLPNKGQMVGYIEVAKKDKDGTATKETEIREVPINLATVEGTKIADTIMDAIGETNPDAKDRYNKAKDADAKMNVLSDAILAKNRIDYENGRGESVWWGAFGDLGRQLMDLNLGGSLGILFRVYEDWQGLSKLGSLFMDSEKLQERKQKLDKEFCDAGFGGTTCWTSQLCTKFSDFIPNPGEGTLVDADMTKGTYNFVANIQAERSPPISMFNDTSKQEVVRYLYRTTFLIKNPTEGELQFNILYRNQAGVSRGYYGTNESKSFIPAGSTASASSTSTIVFYAQTQYNEVCLTFSPALEVSGKKVSITCRPIPAYNGGPTNYNQPTGPAPPFHAEARGPAEHDPGATVAD